MTVTFDSKKKLLYQNKAYFVVTTTTTILWLSGFCPELPNLNFPEQETVSVSCISWAICKSAPHPRQITMPTPHHTICSKVRKN